MARIYELTSVASLTGAAQLNTSTFTPSATFGDTNALSKYDKLTLPIILNYDLTTNLTAFIVKLQADFDGSGFRDIPTTLGSSATAATSWTISYASTPQTLDVLYCTGHIGAVFGLRFMVKVTSSGAAVVSAGDQFLCNRAIFVLGGDI